MPKLSNARRYRRQLDLAGYCMNQTLRKVSEEDIQEQSSQSDATVATDLHETKDCESRPRLKRREPSTCLSDLCFLSPLPKDITSENENHRSGNDDVDAGRTVSPVWGHFVDVILDDEDRPSPMPSRFEKELPVWSGTFQSHSPYGDAARKRLRLRSPPRAHVEDNLDGFILQDPSTLHDALSRLSV